MDNILASSYCGMALTNPVLIGSSGLTETADRIARTREGGAAGAVMKTLTLGAQAPRRRPTPHFRAIVRSGGPLTAASLYSYEHPNLLGPDEYCEEMRKARRASGDGFLIFGSIQCFGGSDSDLQVWQDTAAKIASAGADGIELNVSMPALHMRWFQGQFVEGRIVEIVAAVEEGLRGTPLSVKLSSQFARLTDLVPALSYIGARGVVMFNRVPALDFDIHGGRPTEPIMHKWYAGYGGPWMLPMHLAHICRLREILDALAVPELWENRLGDVDICGSGGIGSGEDVVKYLLAGAEVVQIATIVYLVGYGVIGEILAWLRNFVGERGGGVRRLVGAGAKLLVQESQVGMGPRRKAKVCNEKCDCGRSTKCDKVCMAGAIRVEAEGRVAIDANRCDGCGLCTVVCSQNAIEMIELGR